MTALSAAYKREMKETYLPAYPAKADAVIYEGALVKIGADGYLAPCAAEVGAVFAGIASEGVDMTGLTSGDYSIEVEAVKSFYAAGAGFTVADIGKKVYAADDNTVQLAAGTNLQEVGRIIEFISATKVLVKPNADLVKA